MLNAFKNALTNEPKEALVAKLMAFYNTLPLEELKGAYKERFMIVALPQAPKHVISEEGKQRIREAQLRRWGTFRRKMAKQKRA